MNTTVPGQPYPLTIGPAWPDYGTYQFYPYSYQWPWPALAAHPNKCEKCGYCKCCGRADKEGG